MKTAATALFVLLSFWAASLEVQKHPQRYYEAFGIIGGPR